jgi:uncharacterized protein
MYIKRNIENTVKELCKQYPIVTITGPRQSGKTTLVKHLFKEKPYYSLENPDTRQMITSDPRAFLNTNADGALLDEAHKYPEIFSYLQGHVDEKKQNGMFILTGSNQFSLMENISQSLADRTAILKLLPFSIQELNAVETDQNTDEYLLKGFFPGIYENNRNPTIAYRNYYETYIERDVRQLSDIRNFDQFQRFIKLCAGRIGQVFNASHLANETGVSVPTIQNWINVLKISFIVFFLEPYHENIRKRLTKSPKLYFTDTGLAAYLLGIENINQMSRDPLRNNLFENMVIVDYLKYRYNIGLDPNVYFYRDSHQNEVDLVIKNGQEFIIAEVKSSQTYNSSFNKGLIHFESIFKSRILNSYIVYDGDQITTGEKYRLVNFRNFISDISTAEQM